jgi:hypothetical protein
VVLHRNTEFYGERIEQTELFASTGSEMFGQCDPELLLHLRKFDLLGNEPCLVLK